MESKLYAWEILGWKQGITKDTLGVSHPKTRKRIMQMISGWESGFLGNNLFGDIGSLVSSLYFSVRRWCWVTGKSSESPA